MRSSSLRVSILLIVALLASSCASYQQQPSAVEQARLAYVDAGLAYNFACDTIVALADEGLVTNAQWLRFKAAQAKVRTYAPMVRAGIDLWKESGTEPATLASSLVELNKAFAEVAAIKLEAQR